MLMLFIVGAETKTLTGIYNFLCNICEYYDLVLYFIQIFEILKYFNYYIYIILVRLLFLKDFLKNWRSFYSKQCFIKMFLLLLL